MKSQYMCPGCAPKPVKNLAWLFRHASEVNALAFRLNSGASACDGVFHARLNDGTIYSTEFASIAVCFSMAIRRPSWRGLPFRVSNDSGKVREWTLGSVESKQLARKEWGAMNKELKSL